MGTWYDYCGKKYVTLKRAWMNRQPSSLYLGCHSSLCLMVSLWKKVLTQHLSHRLSKSARLDVENFTLLWNGFLDIYRISEWWCNKTVYFTPAFQTLQDFYLNWIFFCSIFHKVLVVTSVSPSRDASNVKYRHLKQFLVTLIVVLDIFATGLQITQWTIIKFRAFIFDLQIKCNYISCYLRNIEIKYKPREITRLSLHDAKIITNSTNQCQCK